MSTYTLDSDSHRWWWLPAAAGVLGTTAAAAILVVPTLGTSPVPVAPAAIPGPGVGGGGALVENPCRLARDDAGLPSCVRYGERPSTPQPRRPVEHLP